MPASSVPKVFVVIPVFNRIEETVSCMRDLRRQRYPNVQIVVVDGGSTDDTVAQLRQRSEVHLISGVGEQWWTGATWFGIEYALEHGGDDDFVMLLNQDTAFGPEMLEVLVAESIRLTAAVAPITRARDGSVLNSGTRIDWSTYEITHRKSEPDGSPATWKVDALEGRGSLIPISAIRAAGNVDRVRLPHYAADYEFSLRLARWGCPLMMTNRTSVEVDWSLDAMRPYWEPASFKRAWWELTNRRSFANIAIHFTLIDLAGPRRGRWRLKARMLGGTLDQMARRIGLRYVPWLRTVRSRVGQVRTTVGRAVRRAAWNDRS